MGQKSVTDGRLTKLQKKVLDHLLDKYEQSKTYAGENKVNQHFSCAPAEIYPEYESNYESVDKIHRFEDEMKLLSQQGYLDISWKRESICKLTLTADIARIDEIYQKLGRFSKSDVVRKQKQFFSSHIGLCETADLFCREQLDRLGEGKKIRYPLSDAGIILKLLSRITDNREGILERELSIEVLGDSKIFEKSFRTRVCRILDQYGTWDRAVSQDLSGREREIAILEEYGVYANPSYIYMKGHGSITFSDGTCYALAPDIPVAFSSESISRISCFEIRDHDLMTVENLTSFNRIRRENTFFLYLSGYHNTAKQRLLMKIAEDNTKGDKSLCFYHFGDIDPDGFLILEHLKRETGIDFRPYRMGIPQLDQYAEYTRPLEKNDVTKAENMLGAGIYPDEMRYMLEHGRKLEQEIISWIER